MSGHPALLDETAPPADRPVECWLIVTPQAGTDIPRIQKALLAVEIVWMYGRSRWLLSRMDLTSALARLRGRPPLPGAPAAPDELDLSIRLGKAVSRTLSALPVDATCLMRSLVLSTLLARRDIRSELVIGVEPGEEFGAHAWVERDGRALLPHEDFTRLHAL